MTDRNGRLELFGDGSAWISVGAVALFTDLPLIIGYVLRTGPVPADREEPAPTDHAEPAPTEVRHG